MSIDVSLLVSLLLGLPVAILATLWIIDWWKKRKASGLKVAEAKQENASLELPTEQKLAPIISQAELITEAEKRIAEKLRHYEANHWR